MKCGICHYVNPPEGPKHNARTCPLKQVQCRRTLPEDHPFFEQGQCVSAACVHKQMCNTCGVQGHLYGTQALNVTRWKLNSNGRLVRKQTKQPLSKDDFVCRLMTDLSIQSMVDNSVSVSTTAAEAAHSRRVATSRLHANTHIERLDIDETVRLMEGLGSDAAVLKEENKKGFKTLYSNMHLGAAAANRLAASAAESSMDDSTPQPSDDEQNDEDMPHSSEEDAAAAAAGARAGSRTRRRGRGGGRGGGGGVGSGGGGGSRGGGGGIRHKTPAGSSGILKSVRVHHATRQGKTDRYAAAVAKSQRPSSAAMARAKGNGKGKSKGRKGSDAVLTIDVDDSDGAQAAGSAAAAEHDGWPAGTRERFTSLLPEFFSPRFGGTPPVLVAHAVVSELYQCPFEDVDTDVAGVVVKGASDAQVRGFMLISGTLTPALVSEWLCSAMSPALRLATLPSMALAVQRVVNKAMDAAGRYKVAVAAAAASGAAAASAAAKPSAPRSVTAPHSAGTSLENVSADGLRSCIGSAAADPRRGSGPAASGAPHGGGSPVVLPAAVAPGAPGVGPGATGVAIAAGAHSAPSSTTAGLLIGKAARIAPRAAAPIASSAATGGIAAAGVIVPPPHATGNGSGL